MFCTRFQAILSATLKENKQPVHISEHYNKNPVPDLRKPHISGRSSRPLDNV